MIGEGLFCMINFEFARKMPLIVIRNKTTNVYIKFLVNY